MARWKVIPKTVLYYYDGPTVFTADVGLTEFLFYKIDEDTNSDLFLIAPTTRQIVSALEKRALSLRGALANALNFWIIDVAHDQNVRRYWKLEVGDIDEGMLPDSGLALSPLKSPAADFVEQAIAFFSARFTGENLAETSIPFVRFKQIIDSAYGSFRKIFPAPVLENRSLARSLDFGLLQPKFSSLIVAIDMPSVDAADVRKYLPGQKNIGSFDHEFEKNRKDFSIEWASCWSRQKKAISKRHMRLSIFIR